MSKVYVTQETSVDYSGSFPYGDLVFLTRDDFNNMQQSLHNEALVRHLKHALRDFDPINDWVIVSGSPYVSAAVFMILGLAHHRRVRILRWDNRDLVYRPCFINIGRAEVAIGDRQ